MKNYKKKYGQNFLRHPRFAAKLVEALSLNEGDTVIEIGPGNGMITNIILERHVKLICIEVDYDLLANLIKKFRENPDFNLEHQDFLKIDLEELFAKYQLSGNIKFIGNLPFNISKKIINKLLQFSQSSEIKIERMAFIVQDEVAKDYAANPPKATFLSTSANLLADIKKLESVPSSQFIPFPKVNGGIIVIKPYNSSEDINILNKFVGIGFSSPRKKLLKNLENSNKYSKEDLQKVFKEMQIDENTRASELSVEQWKTLHDKLLTI